MPEPWRGRLIAAVRTPSDSRRPRPTLLELQRSHSWTWVYREKCLRHAPMALVPLIIRWGAEASSDRLRQRARCTKCGHKGATLQHPGWAGTHIGFQPFPISVDSSSRRGVPSPIVRVCYSTSTVRLGVGSSAGARGAIDAPRYRPALQHILLLIISINTTQGRERANQWQAARRRLKRRSSRKAINLAGALASAQYERTPAQVDKIESYLNAAVRAAVARLRAETEADNTIEI